MKLALQATLFIGLLALCLATSTIKWCTTSEPEQAKCLDLKEGLKTFSPSLSCVRKTDIHACISAIANSEADAITLDGGHIFDAGLQPHNLKPVVAETYATRAGQDSSTSYYAVAIAKKGTVDSLCDLKGKKSCHTGYGRSAGWIIPLGTLLMNKCITWDGTADVPIDRIIAEFFAGCCVPGAPRSEPNLCSLCAGKGPEKCSRNDPYAGYSGAFQCLRDGVGDVAFVKHTTALNLTEQEKNSYELICKDGTKKPVDQYEECFLAKVPAHAVVTRPVEKLSTDIWEWLNEAQKRYPKGTTGLQQLFGSPRGRDLMFKDSTVKFVQVPASLDAQLYLGQYYNIIQNFRRGRAAPESAVKITWCTIGHDEKKKCDLWSTVSNGAFECATADNTEDCIIKILKGEADAMSLDGGHIYTAGQCGLVPVMAEVYNNPDACTDPGTPKKAPDSYFAVAVVKKSTPGITWQTLKGKKSCHTGVDRTAGWNIPMGLIHNVTGSCEFDKFFSEGCAPGSPPQSPLCKMCKGSGSGSGSGDDITNIHKCKANSNEQYYGYNGAFRCLIEKGEVAFIKHTTVNDNTVGPNKPAWVGDLTSNDFELLCLDGTRRPVSDYESCHLARVPTHAVVTRPEKAADCRTELLKQQNSYGNSGTSKDTFEMFKSETKDSLFKDGTQCLVSTVEGESHKTFLGKEYLDSISGLKKCSPSELLKACNFRNL